jgi:hypothetical protein
VIGGFGLFFGLPIMLIGIVDLARYGVYGAGVTPAGRASARPLLVPTPSGLAFQF